MTKDSNRPEGLLELLSFWASIWGIPLLVAVAADSVLPPTPDPPPQKWSDLRYVF